MKRRGHREKPAALPKSCVDMTVVWGQIWGQLIPLINASGGAGRDVPERRFVFLSVAENS